MLTIVSATTYYLFSKDINVTLSSALEGNDNIPVSLNAKNGDYYEYVISATNKANQQQYFDLKATITSSNTSLADNEVMIKIKNNSTTLNSSTIVSNNIITASHNNIVMNKDEAKSYILSIEFSTLAKNGLYQLHYDWSGANVTFK